MNVSFIVGFQILPEGIGFKLGADTEYKHLVILIHYKNQVGIL
jgi:hypothetical protein